MKKVKIIGAGIAGLSVGCYLQMNGYETEIFEKHNLPGGLCTGWNRGGYHFDGCIHWLLGSGEGSGFYKLWSELIDIKTINFVNHDIRVAIEVKEHTDKYGSKLFYLYTDTERLQNYLLDLSPEDEPLIKDFIRAIRRIKKYDLPPLVDKAPKVRSIMDWLRMVKYLPLLSFLNKWVKITNKGFAKRLKNPFLGEVFEQLYDGRNFTLLMMIMQLAYYGKCCGGYPGNGSLAFAKQIEKRYYELGGAINYNEGVSRILTKENKAVGLLTENNRTAEADLVISAADWNFTVFQALEGKYTNPAIISLKNQERLQVFESVLLISLGVSADFRDKPYLLRFPLKEPLKLKDGSEYQRMEAHIYNYDKSLAPEGKTVIIVTLMTKNADYWINLRKDAYEEYKEIKNKLADKVIHILDDRLGNVMDKVEAADVATPATFLRYTGNYKGSIQGWMPDKLMGVSPVKNTLPGLENFYMTGHWLEPGGGLPIALLTGRNLAQVICRKEHKKFNNLS